MIHQARQSAKFIDLKRKLRKSYPGLPVGIEPIAVGLLECLWHLTQVSAPRGDIGRIPDSLIAEAVGWHDDPEQLIVILLETGWLDSHPDHRLIVHDWAEHAPKYLNRNIARKGGFVCNKPDHTGSGEAISATIPTQVKQESPVLVQEAPTPNLTKPNLTKPKVRKPPVAPLEDLIPPEVPFVLQCSLVAWIAHRQEIRKPLKPTTFDTMLARVDQLTKEFGATAVIDAIGSAISNGYQGWDFKENWAKLRKGQLGDDGLKEFLSNESKGISCFQS